VIALTALTTDRLLVGLVLFIGWLTWDVVKAVQDRHQRPVAGRRSHAVTVRGVRPCIRMRTHLSPAQRAVINELYARAEPVKLTPRADTEA